MSSFAQRFGKGLMAGMEDDYSDPIDDSVYVEHADNTADVDAGLAEVGSVMEDAGTLSALTNKAQELQDRDGGLDETAAEVLDIAVEAIYSRLAITRKPNLAMESFVGKNGKRNVTMALEGLGEMLSKIWQAIKDAFKKVWEWIKSFFVSSESVEKKQELQLEKIVIDFKQLETPSKQNNDKPTTVAVALKEFDEKAKKVIQDITDREEKKKKEEELEEKRKQIEKDKFDAKRKIKSNTAKILYLTDNGSSRKGFDKTSLQKSLRVIDFFRNGGCVVKSDVIAKSIADLSVSIGEEKSEITNFKEYLHSKKIKSSDFYDKTLLDTFKGEVGEGSFDRYTIELGFGGLLEGTLPSPKIDNASFFLKFGEEDKTFITYYQDGSDLDQFPEPLTSKDVNDIYTSFFKGRNFKKAKNAAEGGMNQFEGFIKDQEAEITKEVKDKTEGEEDRSLKIRANLILALSKAALNAQRNEVSTAVAVIKYVLDLRSALLDYCYYSYKIALEGR